MGDPRFQVPVFPPELAAAIAAVAKERSLAVASNTHYDAVNMELRWWSRGLRHRLDFEAMGEDRVEVVLLRDAYPFPARFHCWARSWVPMFPVLPHTDWRPLGACSAPFSTDELKTAVRGFLDRCS